MSTGGKRAGSRKAAKKRSLPSRTILLLCLAVTLCVVAWGFLVYAAIDFGAAARGGDSQAWIFLAVACLGAAACLFAGLMLGARILTKLGIIGTAPSPTAPSSTGPTAEPEAGPDPERLDGVQPTLTVSPVIETEQTGPTRAAVPNPRSGEPSRGRRIAEKGHHPEGPRQSGGRRIARR